MAEYSFKEGKINIHIDPTLFGERDEMADSKQSVINMKLTTATACLTYVQSIYIAQVYFIENSAVMASVIGPIETRSARKEKLANARVEIIMKTGNFHIENKESLEGTLRLMANSLIQVDQYPKCLIQLVFHIIKADGSVFYR